jgi:hypothetical protein
VSSVSASGGIRLYRVACKRGAPRVFEVEETWRNEPARQFLADPAFRHSGHGRVEFDSARFLKDHSDIGSLIQLVEP